MNREQARRLLAALRQGDRKALDEFRRTMAFQWEPECAHCRHHVRPILRGHDFDELVVTFECPLCGKPNRIAMKSFSETDLRRRLPDLEL